VYTGNGLYIKKNYGKVELVLGMFAFLVVLLVMFFGLKITHFMIAGAYVEDALAASNLASALIDVEEYGKNGTISIREPANAFRIYREALSTNLQLDEDGNSFQRELLQGPVRILSYIVYNVRGDQVEAYTFDGDGNMTDVQQGEVGAVYTPEGVLVETTAIYSRVEFGVRGIGKQFISAQKEKCVDIKRNQYEENNEGEE